MKKFFLLMITIFISYHFSLAQQTIPLYDKVPDSRADLTYKEKADMGQNGINLVSNVSIPAITVYRPDKNIDQHVAIIICPGGGYQYLAVGWEGSEIAEMLVKWGITAIVLKYRLPSDSIMIDKAIGPLQDAQRAIQLIRMNAKKWNIDGAKIGVMGFSAGGHLASTLSTHFDEAVIDNPQHISLRPDFSVLGYPVISMNAQLTHTGSRDALIGANPDHALVEKFSNELHISKNTPPTFIVLASDDKTVNPLNSIFYYEALLKNNVPVEMHIYQNGGHGFASNAGAVGDNWMDRLQHWLQHNHYLNQESKQ
ncbi:MAG TPA: alpha/beta hydrolase [Arachidicoccus sp.]